MAVLAWWSYKIICGASPVAVSFVVSLLCLEQGILDNISVSGFTLCSEVSLRILQFLFGHIFSLCISSPVSVNLAFKFNKQGHDKDGQHFHGKHLGRKGPDGLLDHRLTRSQQMFPHPVGHGLQGHGE